MARGIENRARSPPAVFDFATSQIQKHGGTKMYYDLVESGKRIKALRKEHGLTQEQLAEQLAVFDFATSQIQKHGGTKMYYDLVESGKRIKALRKEHGLTQEQLAEQLGVAANTIARIETGNRGISIDLAIELVVRFDTTLDYIFLGRE